MATPTTIQYAWLYLSTWGPHYLPITISPVRLTIGFLSPGYRRVTDKLGIGYILGYRSGYRHVTDELSISHRMGYMLGYRHVTYKLGIVYRL